MKIGWFMGDAQMERTDGLPVLCQDEIMEQAEAKTSLTPHLRILLIPDNASLTDLRGDDWDDRPANCNASEPYSYPEGSRWLVLTLGDAWPPLAPTF